MDHRHPASPARALAELRAGNQRFVTGARTHPNQGAERRAMLSAGQHPFAVLLGCSDSRLAAEIIFDRGLGDLFVVRTAGHTLDEAVLGSIEYGVAVLGTPLVVVLGHDSCGALLAAQEVRTNGNAPQGHLRAIVERVAPTLAEARAQQITDRDAIGNLHVRCTVAALLDQSDVLASAVAEERCAVVGMWYRLAAGKARIITDHPAVPA